MLLAPKDLSPNSDLPLNQPTIFPLIRSSAALLVELHFLNLIFDVFKIPSI